MPPSIKDDDNDSEGDNLFLERLLHDVLIPLPDTLDFSNVVRVFLPFFTYPVTSSILYPFRNEDTIFDPGITINHFYSFKPGLSHQCKTFKKFNTHRSHLNESLMEILFQLAPPWTNEFRVELGSRLVKMSRDVLIVSSTMRIPLLYRGEYSLWSERFMNYLEEQTDGEAMINSIKNGDQPLPRVTQVSIAGTSSTEQPLLKDKSIWSDREKRLKRLIVLQDLF
nr:hypothetical protein [Tanacetum cinerariifolium]